MPLSLNSFTPATTIESAPVNSNFTDIQNAINNLRPQIWVPIDGQVEVQTTAAVGKYEFQLAASLTIVSVALQIETAPTGSALIVDINKNGSSIFSTRPQINASSTTGGSSAVLSTTTVADGDYLTFDIDQVGSTIAGSDLVIGLAFRL